MTIFGSNHLVLPLHLKLIGDRLQLVVDRMDSESFTITDPGGDKRVDEEENRQFHRDRAGEFQVQLEHVFGLFGD